MVYASIRRFNNLPYLNGVFMCGTPLQWYKLADVKSFEELDVPYLDMHAEKMSFWRELIGNGHY